MYLKKEIYFLYMWTSTGLEKCPLPKTIHNYMQNCPKLYGPLALFVDVINE